MQTTLAYAPTSEDLEDIDLQAPVILLAPPPGEDEEAKQGEP